VVNGTSYQAFLTGGLTFTAEPFVVPPAPNWANGPSAALSSGARPRSSGGTSRDQPDACVAAIGVWSARTDELQSAPSAL